MSFTAPDTDTDPSAGFTAPADDMDPPKSVGGFLENVLTNAAHDINPVNMVKGAADTLKTGLYDLPKAAIESSADLVKGAAKAATTGELPSAEDVSQTPILEKTREMTEPIAKDPTGFLYNKPVDAALLAYGAAAPFLGAEGAAAGAAEGAAEAPKPLPAEEGLHVIEPEANAPPTGVPQPAGGSAMPKEEAVPPPKSQPFETITPPAPPKDPLQDVKNYISSKYQAAAGKPGVAQKLAKILDEESANLGAKDLGLQGRQIQSMGQGFEGLEKAKQLVNYAREKGYFDPTLTDVSRKDLIKTNMEKSGQQLGALRDLASQRGAPPIDQMRTAIKTELANKFGIDAPREINKVMAKFEKQVKTDPSFSGMSKLATDLNADATPVKNMGQHPGPTTEGANIVSRLNNDAARKLMNPQESDLYTQSLRDFGANKKLEQATAAGGRRAMAARSNQRGILGRLYQEALDRGGYRLGGNIANKTAQAIMKNPKIQTLPQFFEELGHQADTALDDTIGGMFKGGPVPSDVKQWVASR